MTAIPQHDRFIAFIVERERIRRYRERGDPRPWTNDPILATYRFTNVHREDDRVTRWLKLNWRDPHADDPDLWFAIAVARFVNQPATLARLGYPVPWHPAHFLNVMSAPNPGGVALYNAAYMVRSTTEYAGRSKAEYLVDKQFTPYWQRRVAYRPSPGDTVTTYHDKLCDLYGMGSFMAAQIVADLKHYKPLSSSYPQNWWRFAASGPGSRRGLNYVLGRTPDAPWTEAEWRTAHATLLEEARKPLEPEGIILDGQDLQNCLCEFSKYQKASLGTGRPKQFFKPNPEPLP
jgi:hypothetical protein